jgi:hypothetical protein
MKGYKASYNGKCMNQHYKVGKTYRLWQFWRNPKICEYGFHFCQKPDDVLKYYSILCNDFTLFEIEALGKIATRDDKSCTNKIKIVRIIPKEEYDDIFQNNKFRFDEYGNLIYYKNSSGYEYKAIY